MRFQLGTSSHFQRTLPGSNSDIYMVSRFELSWSSLLVGITFLSVLGNLQVLFYLSHLLFHFFQHVGSKINPLYEITPADWSVTQSTIEGFEGAHLQGCLVAVVVG
jgi:hypothetical protein